MEVLIIILMAFGGYIALTLIYSLIIYFVVKKSLKQRSDKNPLLQYFTAEDYPHLNNKTLSFTNSKGTVLNGIVYAPKNDDADSLILFFHGFGSGHQAYTTLINDLVVTNKMPVIAFDYTGCDLSEGDKVPDYLQALSDGHDILGYITSLPEYKDKKLMLIGHSWGGFVATNLSPYNRDKKISRVISLNGVTDFSLLFRVRTKAPAFFTPLNNILHYKEYKQFAFANTRNSIKNTTIPHLFIHGEQDEDVKFSPFVSMLVLQSDKNNKIKFFIEKEKFHNVYLTKESEQNLRSLRNNLGMLRKNKDNTETLKKIGEFDFSTAVINDPNILNKINIFMKE